MVGQNVETAAPVDADAANPDAKVFLKVGADGQDSRVLHRRHDQFVAALAMLRLAQGGVVRLGGAGGEHDLVRICAAEQGLHLSPRLGDRAGRHAAEIMAR